MIYNKKNTQWMRYKINSLFLAFCFSFSSIFGVTVDLIEPTFCEGVLTSEKGGVIVGEGIRIQARKISYINKEIEGKKVVKLEAQGDLLVELPRYVIAGEKLVYDFEAKEGIVYDGRTSSGPWFFGGEEIRICSDGSYVLYNGFATTSESRDVDWEIKIQKARLDDDKNLTARNVQFRFINLPLFWMPAFRINLDTLFDAPVRYIFRLGGHQGPRIGMIYEMFTWRRLTSYLRLDYRFKRGPGIGIEFDYSSPDHRETFQGINYGARDSKVTDPDENVRYRFQGIYQNFYNNDRSSFLLTYDKLSDEDMPTDYYDHGLEIDKAKRTMLQFRHQEPEWIVNFLTRVRVNHFQTVKQELPTVVASMKPFEICNTGILMNPYFKASYLDFEYRKNQQLKDYASKRIEGYTSFYKPFSNRFLTITPEIGGLAIYYDNSPEHFERWLTAGIFKCDAVSYFNRKYGKNCKHVMSPYLQYNFVTYPSTPPDDHFVFDIDDGWFKLNMLTFGWDHSFYTKNDPNGLRKVLFFDTWANAFFDTPTIPQTIPKIYANLMLYPTTQIYHGLSVGWDLEEHVIDHWNYQFGWTISTDAAFNIEYRNRSAFAWRKTDYDNFMLDSFHTIEELLHSSLSDRRDTLLLHFFWRFHPSWALEFEQRIGWHRKHEPAYDEYEINLLGNLGSSWTIKLAYRHRTDDDRFFINLFLEFDRPNCNRVCPPPLLQY